MPKVCYACLNAPGVTRDHVPAKCFFPTPKPLDLITVACCEECNNGNSSDDAYVWFVLAGLYGESEVAEQLFEQKLPNFVRCNPRVVEEISATMRDSKIVIDGVPEEVGIFDPDPERIIPYFERVVKGLLRTHYPDYDYSKSAFHVSLLNQWDERLEKLESLRDVMRYDAVGEGVFQYRHTLTESRASGLWLLVFYGKILVLVHHTNLPPQF